MNKFFVFLLILVTFSCTNTPRTINNSSRNDIIKFFEINYEKVLQNKQVLRLSEIASNVEYVRLETNKNCLIRPVVKYFFTDSLIFVQNVNEILKFSRDGRFLKKIGNPGRGPGEIDVIRLMSILLEERLIAIQKNQERTLLFFSFNGDLVKTIKFESDISYTKVLPDKKYITYEPGFRGSEKYTFCLMNENWDTLSIIENYSKWIRTPSMLRIMITYPQFEPFYFSMGKCHFKSMYNDTIYVNNFDKIYPEYFINLGKYKLPEELRPERVNAENYKKFEDNQDKYFFVNVFEASNKIFLSSSSYSETFVNYTVFDKIKRKGLLLLNRNSVSTGFINDWDGGMDFYPIGCVNENQVYMPINAMDIQEKHSSNHDYEEPIAFPEKEIYFKKLISNIDMTDNPIIMVVTLKEDN